MTTQETPIAPDPALQRIADVAEATGSLTRSLVNLSKVHESQLNEVLQANRNLNAALIATREVADALEAENKGLSDELVRLEAQNEEVCAERDRLKDLCDSTEQELKDAVGEHT